MSHRVVLKEPIQHHTEFIVTTLNIVDGLITKGKYKTPLTNILYIEEI